MAFDRLTSHLAGYLPINLIEALSSLGIVVIYSRLLTPEQYGRYALAVTAMQWLQTLLFYWLHSGVARFFEARRTHGRVPALLVTSYVAALALSGLLAIGVGYVAAGLSDQWRWLVLAGLVSLVARALLLIGLEAHRAGREVRRYSGLEGLQYLMSLGLGALLVSGTGGGAAAILWATTLACLLVLLLDTRYLAKLMSPPAWSGDELRLLIRYGAPLAASVLLGQIIAKSDRFFIAWLMDEKAVGIYSVAYALIDRPSTIIFNWLGMAAVPLAFAAMERDGPAAAREVMAKTAKTLVLLLLPCTTGLAIVAEPLAAVLFGAEFRHEAARLIPWIALASLLYGAMIHYAAHAFMVTKNTRLLLMTSLFVLVLNMILNLLLIPLFGLDGAVAASITTYGLGLTLRLIIARRFFPLPLAVSHLIRGLLACGVMAGVIWSAALAPTLVGLMLAILLGVVSYVVGALLLNVADCRDALVINWRRRMGRGMH
ncbi:lipopolysaccharide biosynthesis protein [uncultured Thiodictyon sp.]|uniref:lipopolysaccharide biosynthesis protein n=1 Tax=uncultured Thiodictyon sp. TaxID=1846217 RepID=UPI0025DC000F|nr:lipopolysaccharide biosynthesis protein [uncultured Thiodictyon sp.]